MNVHTPCRLGGWLPYPPLPWISPCIHCHHTLYIQGEWPGEAVLLFNAHLTHLKLSPATVNRRCKTWLQGAIARPILWIGKKIASIMQRKPCTCYQVYFFVRIIPFSSVFSIRSWVKYGWLKSIWLHLSPGSSCGLLAYVSACHCYNYAPMLMLTLTLAQHLPLFLSPCSQTLISLRLKALCMI